MMLEQQLQTLATSPPKIKKSNTATKSFLNGQNNRGVKMGEAYASQGVAINSQIQNGTLQEPANDDQKLRQNVTHNCDQLLTSIMEATSQNQFRTTQNQLGTFPQKVDESKQVNQPILTEQIMIPQSVQPKLVQIDYSKIMLTLSLPQYLFKSGGRSTSSALILSQQISPQHHKNTISGQNQQPKKKPAGAPSLSRTIDLSNFNSLIILNISNCCLKSINTLKRSIDTLRFLNASDNFLQSGFPQLPIVEELYLARNQFKKTDYLSKCKKVKVLDISFNYIQDCQEIYRVGRELDDLCAVRLEGNPIKTKV